MEIELTGRYYNVDKIIQEIQKQFPEHVLSIETIQNNAYCSGNTIICIHLINNNAILRYLLRMRFKNVGARLKINSSYQIIEYANMNKGGMLEFISSENSPSMELDDFEDLEHYDFRMQLNGVRC